MPINRLTIRPQLRNGKVKIRPLSVAARLRKAGRP